MCSLPAGAALPTLLMNRCLGAQAQGPAEKQARKPPQPLVTLAEEPSSEYVVKNTFIDCGPEPLSPSMELFYCQREVVSCPGLHTGRLLRSGALLQEALPQEQQAREPRANGDLRAPASSTATLAPEAVATSAAGFPSAGSAGHAAGQCKPCAFFHKKGCEQGAACAFCHLCPPGEKRRRQKEKFSARPPARKQF